MLTLLILLGSGMNVWGNSSTFEGSSLNGFNTGLAGAHVSFKISGGEYKSEEWLLCSLKKSSKSFQISWQSNSGVSIKVTKVSLKMLGYGAASQVKAKINGGNDIEIGSVVGASTTVEASNSNGLSSGTDLTVTCSSNIAARDIRIKSATFEYTITPNAPTLNTTSKTITVTETLDVSGCFTVPDADFTKAYGTSGGKLNGSVFSADKAGTYQVYSYITAKDGCHAKSANSSNLSIIVNRLAGNISLGDASSYVNDALNLSSCITSSLGTGAVTYQIVSDNSGDVEITGDSFTAHKEGTYTIKATKAQDDQYYEASTTFAVTVSKKNQALTFTATSFDKNVVQGTTVAGAATATASSGLSVTYSSGNDAVLTVNENGDVTGVTPNNDDVTVTASQAGNDEYNPCSIERVFHVIEKKETSFTTTLTGDNSTIHVGDQHTITVKDEGDGFTYTSSDTEVLTIAKEESVITLTAVKVGTSTVTLTQPETPTHAAVTKSYVITVEKVANTLGVTPAAYTASVDGTITVNVDGQNNTETPIEAVITDQKLSSDVNNGENVITYADGVITAVNAGTAKITFSQAATDMYGGYTSSTYEITVSKISNPITVTLNGGSSTSIKLKYGATATLSYTSAHTETEFSVNRTSGSYTSLSGDVITAGNAAGTDIYEIVQDETYKYEKGYAQFSVRVNNTDEEEMYIVNEETEYSGWELTTLHSYSLDGHPGDILYFEAKKYSTGFNTGFYAEYSLDGGQTWQKEWYSISVGNDWRSYAVPLPDGVTNVRFQLYTGSTMNKYIRNVKVSRKTYVRATSDKTDLGTVYTDGTATATVAVSYSTTNGGNISVSSNNSRFAVSTEQITTTNNSDGTVNLTVTYTPDPNQLGSDEATVTIQDLFYSAEVKLTATAAKHDNTLALIGAQKVKVDDIIYNVYTEKNSDAEIISAISPEGVITYDAEANSIKAVGAGEATLTLTQNANDTHLGTTKSVKVTVSKYDQTITWDNELSGDALTLRLGDVLSDNTATASSGLAVTYSSSNASAIEVNPTTGEMTAKAIGSHIAVTATQEGNYKYNSVSVTRYFTVVNSELVLYPAATTDLKYNEYSKVTLMRTLKKGYNSIALPFNTTVEELAGEGDGNWVAQLSTVTYNAKDGYSLYFKKVEDGTMTANQPYILYLAKEVENPVFNDKEVEALTSTEHAATNGVNASDWKMVSNYTPKMDMSGKYGVVNADGCLKIGGADSYLNAFTAYIEFTGNQSRQIRTLFVGDEADGIDGVQSEEGQTVMYDLQGRRVYEGASGIVIIRNADGSVRKERR